LRVAEVTEVASYPEPHVDTGEDVERIGTAAVEDELVRSLIRKHAGDEEDEREDVDLVLWVDIDSLIDAVSADGGDDNQR
jgi:purine-binding chemotaxis protein CheW